MGNKRIKMADFKKAIGLLMGDTTLALVSGDTVITKTTRGVAPLLELFDTGEDFSLFSVADRVVGLGAGYLYLALGIKRLFARTISEVALALLQSSGVYVEYTTVVPRIINRAGTGLCPIEECVMSANNTDEAITAIRRKLNGLTE